MKTKTENRKLVAHKREAVHTVNELGRKGLPVPDAPEFKQVVTLLAALSEAEARLAEMEAETNAALLRMIDESKGEYAEMQAVVTNAAAKLELLCRRNPEWFANTRSLKTPYGKVGFRTGTSLEVKDEEATVKLLRAVLSATEAEKFIRKVETPDLEALEKLDEADLARFMVKRVTTDVFSVSAARVDFRKALKEAVVRNN